MFSSLLQALDLSPSNSIIREAAQGPAPPDTPGLLCSKKSYHWLETNAPLLFLIYAYHYIERDTGEKEFFFYVYLYFSYFFYECSGAP